MKSWRTGQIQTFSCANKHKNTSFSNLGDKNPALTHIDEAHHHVGVAQIALVPSRRCRWWSRSQNRSRGSARETGSSGFQRRVVQLQHVDGRRRAPLRRVRTRPPGQAEHGQDLSLHFPALLTAQSSVHESRAQVALHREVCGDQNGAAAPPRAPPHRHHPQLRHAGSSGPVSVQQLRSSIQLVRS